MRLAGEQTDMRDTKWPRAFTNGHLRPGESRFIYPFFSDLLLSGARSESHKV
jgi:hypothetical protein